MPQYLHLLSLVENVSLLHPEKQSSIPPVHLYSCSKTYEKRSSLAVMQRDERLHVVPPSFPHALFCGFKLLTRVRAAMYIFHSIAEFEGGNHLPVHEKLSARDFSLLS